MALKITFASDDINFKFPAKNLTCQIRGNRSFTDRMAWDRICGSPPPPSLDNGTCSLPIIIKKKVGSNKKETLREKQLPPAKNTDTEPVPPPQAVDIAKPFIDRLAVVVKVPNMADAKAMHKAIWVNHEAEDEFPKADKSFKKPKGFQRVWRLALPSLELQPKHWPHFSYAYSKGDDGECYATKLRLDFVPVDLGSTGMAELHAFLTSNMDGGWDFFMEHGHITRMDIAVDFPQLTMSDFHYLHPQGITVKEWRHDGIIGTFQAGKKEGNHTAIYDRGAKRKHFKSEKPGKVGVRVERRLIKINLPLKELAAYKNPLEDFKMVERCPGPPTAEKKPYIWHLFMAAADRTSLTQALALLPAEKKAMYRKHLTQHMQPWWEPEKSWSYWPEMLQNLLPAK